MNENRLHQHVYVSLFKELSSTIKCYIRSTKQIGTSAKTNYNEMSIIKKIDTDKLQKYP